MQKDLGSNHGAAPPTLEPISPIPHFQVAKMRQGSQKGWCTQKPSARDEKKKKIKTYPDAQFPLASPPLSWHSEEATQVPLRILPDLIQKLIFLKWGAYIFPP